MERRAIATLCIGDGARAWSRFTHEPMRMYARKVDADFVVFDQRKIGFKDSTGFNPVLFEKYQVRDLLETYDRVLYIDGDILVTPHAPDVFSIVPPGKIGGVFEDFGTEKNDRRKIIQEVQAHLGDVGWQEGYMNSGVFVVSREHRPAFTLFETTGFFDGQYEQTNTNWYFRKAGFEIANIDFRFNFMGIMRVHHGPIHREAFFIHYAGKGGLFPWVPKLDQVRNDHEYFYEGKDTVSFEEIP